MRSRSHVAVCAIVLVLTAVSAVAQVSTGEVSGRVTSSRDSQPLGLVQVDLVGSPLSVVTDSAGAFRIPNVPAGTYTLRASVVGFRVIEQVFTLAAGEAKTFEVVLTPSTITAERSWRLRLVVRRVSRCDVNDW